MGSNDTESLTETEQTILDLSLENPTITNADIAEELGVSVARVRDVRDEHLDTSSYNAETVAWGDSDSLPPHFETENGANETKSHGDANATEEFN